MAKAHNHSYEAHRKISNAIDHVNSKQILKGNLWKALAQDSPIDREHVASLLKMNPKEVESMKSLYASTKNLHDSEEEFHRNWAQVRNLVSHVQSSQLRKTPNPYGKEGQWPDVEFFRAALAERFADLRMPDAGKLLHLYAKSYSFNRFVGQDYMRIKKDWARLGAVTNTLDSSRPLAGLAKVLSTWLDVVRRGHEPGRDLALDITHSFITKVLRIPITRGEASDLIGGMLNTSYRAMLGWRVFNVVRDGSQPWLAVARLGLPAVKDAYKVALTPGPVRDALLNKLIEAGIVQKGIPPIETGLVATGEFVDVSQRQFTPAELKFREFSQKAKFFARDMVPPALRTVAGTKLDPMWAFVNMGSWNRFIVGAAAYIRFQKAHGAWMNTRSAAVKMGLMDSSGNVMAGVSVPTVADLMREIHGDSFAPPIAQALEKLVSSGDPEQAALYYAAKVDDDVNFRYGAHESAPGWRSHTAKFNLQFGSYSANSLAFLRNATKFGNINYKVATLLAIGGASAALAYLQLKTKWPMMKYIWINPAGYVGGPTLGAYETVHGIAEGVSRLSSGYTPSNKQTQAITGTMEGGFLPEVTRYLNPTQGAFDTYRGLRDAGQSFDPAEAVTRFLLTGDRKGVGTDFKQQFDQVITPEEWYGGEGAQ